MQTKIGKQWVFRHVCQYGDQDKASQMVFYYAPAVGHYVAMEIIDSQKKAITRRELVEYGNKLLADAATKLQLNGTEDYALAEFNKYAVLDTGSSNITNQYALANTEETNGLTDKTGNKAPNNVGSKTNPGAILPPAPTLPPSASRKLFSDPAFDGSVKNYNAQNNPENRLDKGDIALFKPIANFEGRPAVQEKLASDNNLRPFDDEAYNQIRLGKGPQPLDPQGLIAQQASGQLSGTPRQQAEALLAKRYGERVSSSRYAETGEDFDTSVLAQPKIKDKLNGYFNTPTKAIRPNRFVEADTQGDPLLPPNLGTNNPLEYQQDKLSNQEYFLRSNPAYQNIKPNNATEQERLSQYQYRAYAAEPDQLAGARAPKPADYFTVQSARGSQQIKTLEQLQMEQRELQKQQQYQQQIIEQNPLTRYEDRYAQNDNNGYALKLASFANKNQALQAWEQLNQNYPKHFKGLSPAIQEAQANNKVILNLYAVGIQKSAAAVSICQNLQRERINCEVFSQ